LAINHLLAANISLPARRLELNTMFRTIVWSLISSFLLLYVDAVFSATATPPVAGDVNPWALLADAENRFTTPDLGWFLETQEALRAEMAIVGAALDAQGPEFAEPWKQHLRWSLLEKNLVPLADINVAEIELARRWMFSNRKGMELPFYAKLRELTHAYTDAAYTLSQQDLQNQFIEHVSLARKQIAALQSDPSDANAAALGRTLGWFDRTRQLATETAELRNLLSNPNLEILVGKDMIYNFMSKQSPKVEHTLRVADSSEAPPSRRFQIPRTVHVSGTAHSVGQISLEIVPNELTAEVSIVYEGEVDSHCHADAGPVTFDLRTIGPMSANKPVTFGPSGIELSETTVVPHVRTRVTNIQGTNELIARLGERRINDPQNKTHMSRRARSKAVQLLEKEMDSRVGEAIDEIRAEIARTRSGGSEAAAIFAPVVREGAAPYFHSTWSNIDYISAGIMSARREQFGAVTPCPFDFADGDVRVRVHVSFLNNMMETIMAGKMFTDEYFMKYAKVLQPTLPLDLMVHSRTPRWAIIAAKPRPLELSIPSPNVFEFALHIASLEIDGQKFEQPTTVTVRYELVKNDLDEYYLQRDADVAIQSSLPTEHQAFLHKKLSAFFAPVLDGGGVVVPEGGGVGSLNLLKFLGVQADQDWLVLGIDVPAEFIDQAMESREKAALEPLAPEIDASVLPPPFALDEDLSTYPTGM
jgi:hypothetical protein